MEFREVVANRYSCKKYIDKKVESDSSPECDSGL